ncbi:amino acid adenylation domain-containing protein [Exilibacterium tricleocarpae]|uniref:Amino acid adenylation domain-containing protein n=1 Tax=Exilibacterium tricleocarpae TaxID=2591008 RepID=A0A545TFQ5_9GAMM|nr:non-ribosomal peptide synthetase [Exilibacterium tricleocarpae]TQV76053.1 amino acid adenylation domain-containing protein [Exilibacterium tricleocarpae]
MNSRLGDKVRLQHKRELLRRRLEEKAAQSDAGTTTDIVKSPRTSEDGYPLSFAQQRLWVIDQMKGGSPEYNIPKVVDIKGDFVAGVAERAISRIISRHEILRTRYVKRNGGPRQVIDVDFKFRLQRYDLRDLSGVQLQQRVSDILRTESERPFDLSRDLMLRGAYMHKGGDGAQHEGTLLLNMHHIAADGWSMALFIEEFLVQYDACRHGRGDPLRPLEIQYVDYALWQHQRRRGEPWERQLQYWDNQLAALPPLHNLPTDRPRGESDDHAGATYAWRLPAALSDGLRRLAASCDTTLYVVVHAAFSLLLARHSNDRDIVIGAPVANRTHAKLGPLIGFFVNTLVLRVNTDFQSLADYMAHVKSINQQAQENQDVPFEHLVDRLKAVRTSRFTPLIQILLSMNTTGKPELSLPGVNFTPVDGIDTAAKFDLNLIVSQEQEVISLNWFFDTALFDLERIAQMNEHLVRLMTAMVDTPGAALADLPMLSASERYHLLYQLNEIDIDYRSTRLIHQHFENQVLRTPDKVALVYQSEVLTYRALEQASNRLAHCLTARGVETGTLVGLYVERSIGLVVSILGVLKAGGAYVPLDPGYPQSRLHSIMADADLAYVVTESKLQQSLILPDSIQFVCVDCEARRVDHPERALAVPADTAMQTPDSLAYVIYTSGSTGKPKGVLQTHDNVSRLFAVTESDFAFSERDVWTLFHSVSFDFSVWELWGALFYGATLVIPSHQATRDTQVFIELCQCCRVSILNQTPSAFKSFSHLALQHRAQFPRLRYIIFGGEALHIGSLRRWWENYGDRRPELVNMYGITETTVHASLKRLKRADAERSYVGRRLADQAIYLLDRTGNPVPPGTPGEIHIGGAGLAKGYLNQPLLTAERFVENPFSSEKMRTAGLTRLYRTGDLASMSADGQLTYLGRNDEQVKIRGFRLELGEIEQQLSLLSDVQACLVTVREDKAENRSLIAYVVPVAIQKSQAERAWVSALRVELSAQLPEYMIPAFFVVMDSLPLNDNGKVDREKLPPPRVDKAAAVAQEQPVDPLQRYLIDVWRSVLGLQALGVDDSFFEMGGDSLLAIRAVNQVQEYIGEVIHLVVLFEAPTVSEFAGYLARHYGQALVAKGLLAVATGQATGSGEVSVVGADAQQALSRLVPVLPAVPTCGPPGNERVLFILSPPRSGSTLLRVMLAGHPQLFAPPELELLAFDTLKQRRQAFSGPHKFWQEGVWLALMTANNMDLKQAQALMEEFEAGDMSIAAMYEFLQSSIAGEVLVDKTPSYAYSLDILQRAEHYFSNAHYIHLVRHPYGMIASFEKAQLDQLLFLNDHEHTTRQLAELLWTGCHLNILEFLQTIPAARQQRVVFEKLVARPEEEMQRLCDFIDIPFDAALLQPYDGTQRRMSGGVHSESRMLGDIKFADHRKIDRRVAVAWRSSIATDFLSARSKQVARVLGYTEEQFGVSPESPTIPVLQTREDIPLSFSQQRLWFLDRMHGGSSQYNIPVALAIEGRFDVTVAERAMENIIARHQTLRTVFVERGGRPVQVVMEKYKFTIERHDLQGLPDLQQHHKVSELIEKDSVQTFDLSRDLMIRASYLHLAPRRGILIFCLHHIAADGWSLGIFSREFTDFYRAGLNGDIDPSSDLPVQYADYASWQRQSLSDHAIAAQLTYWETQLRDLPLVHAIEPDHRRPATKQYTGAMVKGCVSAAIAGRLRTLAGEKRVTLHMLLHAALGILLSRHSGSDDVVIGTPVANRPRVELEPLIGFFVNTLVLRTCVNHENFTGYLDHVKTVNVEAQANQDLPFDYLVEHLKVPRSAAFAPLFQIAFTLTGAGQATDISLPGVRCSPVETPLIVAKSDLDIIVQDTGKAMNLTWIYDTAVFNRRRIETFNDHFVRLLTGVVDAPDARLSALPMLAESERRYLMHELNRTKEEFSGSGLMHQLFEAQAEKFPHSVALVFQDRALSYGALNDISNRLAHYLRERGVAADKRVGLYTRRSLDMVIGILAVLKAGGAYVPLDPLYPPQRLSFLLRDADIDWVLTESDLAETLRFDNRTVVLLDSTSEQAHWRGYPPENVPKHQRLLQPDRLAYVIYTSGSTGQPKGVMIEHGGAVNMHLAQRRLFDVGRRSRVLQFASLGFDAGVSEWMMALCSGGALYICGEEARLSPDKLREFLLSKTITHATLPPAVLQHLDATADYGLTCLVVAGENCDEHLASCWSSRYPMYNAYGPTETSVCATVARLQPNEPVTIGRPIANTELYVLDSRRGLTPPGALGELYIGGRGLGRGYVNRPELTQECFIQNPFAGSPGDRLYKTGDLVRYTDTGNLIFIGRMDEQIKVRGFRIEPAEIERQISACGQVQSALVVKREDRPGQQRLVAYVVRAGNCDDQCDDRDKRFEDKAFIAWLKMKLREALPDYMVPGVFVLLESYPLTPNGKVDRRALPAPAAGGLAADDFIEPETVTEKHLCELWQALLKVDRVGLADNFFDLGGHSLLAARLVAEIERHMAVVVDVSIIFEKQTVKELARVVDAIETKDRPGAAIESRLGTRQGFGEEFDL